MSKPVLYLFVGYPGAGKTTIARIIAQATDAVHLWADDERHTMFKNPTHTKEESQTLYAHLNQITEDLLAEGKSVVFDTNFNYLADREHLRKIAIRHGAAVKTIWVTTPVDFARKRATEQSDDQETRIWGNMSAEAFDRMSNRLQPPSDYEHAIEIDGTDIDEQAVKAQLEI